MGVGGASIGVCRCGGGGGGASVGVCSCVGGGGGCKHRCVQGGGCMRVWVGVCGFCGCVYTAHVYCAQSIPHKPCHMHTRLLTRTLSYIYIHTYVHTLAHVNKHSHRHTHVYATEGVL